MDIEKFRECCLSLPGVTEDCPWTDERYADLITYRVGGKWFALYSIGKAFCNLKCEPQKVTELLERYNGATPAYHMNKKHWIGIELESDIPDSVIAGLVTGAHALVSASLPLKVRKEIMGI